MKTIKSQAIWVLGLLRGGVALFYASDAVTRAAWRAYVENLKIEDNYPGIQGLGFSKRIWPLELSQHIRQVRTRGFPDYVVKPPGERPEYTAQRLMWRRIRRARLLRHW